jgi:hypothetical protein
MSSPLSGSNNKPSMKLAELRDMPPAFAGFLLGLLFETETANMLPRNVGIYLNYRTTIHRIEFYIPIAV